MDQKNNKVCILILVLFIFSIIYVVYHYATLDNSFNRYKAEKSKNIVYPVYDKDNYYVPKINIKGTAIEEVNNIIVDKANAFIKDGNSMTYKFEINGKILSLAIEYINNNDESGYPMITYDVYNINFYESRILNSQDMLNLYDISESDVAPIVEAKFREYYEKEFQENYFDDECDYDGCFMDIRGIKNNNYMENVNYYIKDGNLYVIKPFNIYSIYNEEEFFSTSDFLIQITDH